MIFRLYEKPLKKPIYFGLEYFGKSSENFEKVVRSVTRKLNLPGQKLVFYYKRGKSLENLFSQNFKNFWPDDGLNGVYKISCKNCEQNYIGETGRPFCVRLSEHEKYSGPLGHYASFDHISRFGHNLDFENSRIVKHESNPYRRKIIESLYMSETQLFENNSCSFKLNVF